MNNETRKALEALADEWETGIDLASPRRTCAVQLRAALRSTVAKGVVNEEMIDAARAYMSDRWSSAMSKETVRDMLIAAMTYEPEDATAQQLVVDGRPELPQSFARCCDDGYWVLRVRDTERFDTHDSRYTRAQEVYSADQMKAFYQEGHIAALRSTVAQGDWMDEMKRAGTLLSNVAFNLAQSSALTDTQRASLNDTRVRWDAAMTAATPKGETK